MKYRLAKFKVDYVYVDNKGEKHNDLCEVEIEGYQKSNVLIKLAQALKLEKCDIVKVNSIKVMPA